MDLGLKQQYEFMIVAVPLAISLMTVLISLQLGKRYIYVPKITPTDIMKQNKTVTEKLDVLIAEAGLNNSLDAVKVYQIIITIFLIITISLFIRGNILGGIVLGIVISISIPVATLMYIKSRRQAQIETQLVDFLNEMSTRMQVSSSTFNGFMESIPNTDFPLRPILENIARNAEHLKSFELALEASRTSITSVYYQDFIDAVEIHRDAGGDIRTLINTVIEQINDKMIALKKFKAALAAINLQLLIIFLAPPLVGWMTTLQNPENANVLFHTGQGLFILAVTLICYFGGVGFSFWLKNRVKKQIG